MTRFKLFLLLFLTLPAWAIPRIALVQPLDGARATLEGRPLVGPQLARDGEFLEVVEGKVRVQLLNSGRELTLDSGDSMHLTRSQIDRVGKQVDRGEIVIERGIASVSKVAGATARRDFLRIGIRVSPPVLNAQGEWVYEVEASDDLPEKYTIYVFYAENSSGLEDAITSFRVPRGVSTFPCPEFAREIGRPYALETHDGAQTARERTYRLLSQDDEIALDAATIFRKREADEQDSLQPLLELAELYQAMNQLERLAVLLLQIEENPLRKRLPESEQLRLHKWNNAIRWSLDYESL